jgi:hypothetical protein
MSADFRVELERPYDYYVAGDTVIGHVILNSTQNAKLSHLEVRHLWRAEGGEQPAIVHVESSVELKPVDVTAGRDHRFKFEFLAERTPATHHGDSFMVRWLVDATARLDTEDFTASSEYIQLAGKRETHKRGKPLLASPPVPGEKETKAFKRHCSTGAQLRPPRVWPGQTTICTFQLRPQKDTELSNVCAVLCCENTSVSGKRKSAKVTSNCVDVLQIDMATEERFVGADETVTFECVVTVPKDADHSAASVRQRSEWFVVLKADAAGLGTLNERFPVIVLGSDD